MHCKDSDFFLELCSICDFRNFVLRISRFVVFVTRGFQAKFRSDRKSFFFGINIACTAYHILRNFVHKTEHFFPQNFTTIHVISRNKNLRSLNVNREMVR